jgi:hypothetical protein
MSTRLHSPTHPHVIPSSPTMLKPPSPPAPSAILAHQSHIARAPLASIDDASNDHRHQQQQLALHASIDTTRSAVDSSSSSCLSASSSAVDSSMECTETLELSVGDVEAMASNYPALASRSLALASQSALDRVHIQSLQAQVSAARLWNASLEEDKERLRQERDQWRSKAEERESALRQTQIMLACLQQVHEPASAAVAVATGQGSPRSVAFDRERRLLSAHHRAALEAKDALISALVVERERAETALRQTRADLAATMQSAAETRYSDAVLASEQREKFQRLVEQQLDQQRRATEEAVTMALTMAETNNTPPAAATRMQH